MKFAVALNMERFDPGRRMDDVMREVLALVQMADRGGFETAWAAEHHTIESIIGPNPLQTLIWWGQHTDRIRLGAATVVAPYWNPIRLAGEAAMCDHLTGGRLELGLGRGAFQYEFDRMAGGIPQQEGVAYLKELLPAVRKLWAGDYAHEGRYWRFPLSTSVPKPKQQPEPPIWVAARDPGTYDWAIANGANILSTPLSSPPAEVLSLGEKFRKAVADHPEVPRPRFMMQRRACIYPRKSDWEEVVRHSSEYGRRFENLFQNAGGVVNGFPEAIDFARVANAANYDPQATRHNMLFGTPDEIIEKIAVYREAGVDQLSINVSFGLPFEMQKTSLQLFIDEVMPVFAQREAARGPARSASVSAA